MEFLRFYELLLEEIEKIGWSKNYVSTAFTINRGTLHKYLTGALLPPKEVFYAMIAAMPISKMEYMRLLDLYCAEFYGKEKYRRIKALEKILKRLDSTCVPNQAPICGEAFDGTAFEKTGKAFLQTAGALLSGVQYMCDTAKAGTLFTNYPYRFQALDAELFRLRCENQGLEIRHFLSFSKDADGFTVTQNLFSSVRWLQNRVNPICCYANGQVDTLQPFPYFIAFHSCVCLFNDDFSKGFLTRDAALCSYLESTCENLMQTSGAVPLAVFPEDMFALKNSVTENSNAVTEASLTQYACVAAIADEAFMGKTTVEEVCFSLYITADATNIAVFDRNGTMIENWQRALEPGRTTFITFFCSSKINL